MHNRVTRNKNELNVITRSTKSFI